MTITRRRFLRTLGGTLASAALAVTIPLQVFAKRSDEAFLSGSLEEAINAKYGSLPIEDSGQIQIKAPQIAENGAFVPVTISTDIPGATSISIFAEANFSPLVASFDVLPRMHPDVSLRIRMAKTSDITVLVKAGDKLYRATREVKVTIGGCGG